MYLQAQNCEIENVDQFTYLGTLITNGNDESKEIQIRISQANKSILQSTLNYEKQRYTRCMHK